MHKFGWMSGPAHVKLTDPELVEKNPYHFWKGIFHCSPKSVISTTHSFFFKHWLLTDFWGVASFHSSHLAPVGFLTSSNEDRNLCWSRHLWHLEWLLTSQWGSTCPVWCPPHPHPWGLRVMSLRWLPCWPFRSFPSGHITHPQKQRHGYSLEGPPLWSWNLMCSGPLLSTREAAIAGPCTLDTGHVCGLWTIFIWDAVRHTMTLSEPKCSWQAIQGDFQIRAF